MGGTNRYEKLLDIGDRVWSAVETVLLWGALISGLLVAFNVISPPDRDTVAVLTLLGFGLIVLAHRRIDRTDEDLRRVRRSRTYG